tara:strand:+ start:108 stop:296 length:189 start_codon:yes stop_codon:yes gene_type:complete
VALGANALAKRSVSANRDVVSLPKEDLRVDHKEDTVRTHTTEEGLMSIRLVVELVLNVRFLI